MSSPSPQKLKVITIMFFVAGVWGLTMGIFYFKNPNFPLTALGIVNLVLGIFMGFRQMKKDNGSKIRKKEK